MAVSTKTPSEGVVLIIGSGPNAVEAAGWDRAQFDRIVAINNAWRVRPDWDHAIYPEDFPTSRRPASSGTGALVEAAEYVPVQNRFGGFVYAGGTMAFTAGYWALGALAPRVLAFIGCDMVYPSQGKTHFYGTGMADPLRADITLQSLEAKSARLELIAARQGCACVNLSRGPSRLLLGRARPGGLDRIAAVRPDPESLEAALAREAALGYMAEDGRYWDRQGAYEAEELAALDALWLAAHEASLAGCPAMATAPARRLASRAGG